MFSTITVHDILLKKGHGYLTIPRDATAYAALEVMADHNVGALLVLDEGNLVGIFSERDYARKVILKGKSSRSTTVGDLMSSTPICASPGTTLQECMVKAIIRTQEATINQLEEYITGDIFPPYIAQ
jgi:CBS domain-containing protein